MFYDDLNTWQEALVAQFLTPDNAPIKERIKHIRFDLEDDEKPYLEVKVGWDGMYHITVHNRKSDFDPNGKYDLVRYKK